MAIRTSTPRAQLTRQLGIWWMNITSDSAGPRLHGHHMVDVTTPSLISDLNKHRLPGGLVIYSDGPSGN